MAENKGLTPASSDAAANAAPPQMTLYQLAIGHFMSRALALVTKLNIAEQLAAGPRSPAELARASETEADALRRVLRFVASAGIFEEDRDGLFRLTPLGEPLRADVPGSMKAMITVFAGPSIQDNWNELEYCVRSGQPAFRKHHPDADAFTFIHGDPEIAATFDTAMATFAPQTAAAVAAAYDFSRFASLVDVGGGNGALLRGILSANPRLRGVLFEQPQVAERARAAVDDARIEIAAGSFFDTMPAGHDAYLLKHVIHDWNDADASAILRVCRKAMSARATLLIVEGVYPARVAASPEIFGATATDVNMLVCTGGRQRSEAEFRELLAGAAFELTRIVPTHARVSVIEAAPR
jgi:hypothetical protein